MVDLLLRDGQHLRGSEELCLLQWYSQRCLPFLLWLLVWFLLFYRPPQTNNGWHMADVFDFVQVISGGTHATIKRKLETWFDVSCGCSHVIRNHVWLSSLLLMRKLTNRQGLKHIECLIIIVKLNWSRVLFGLYQWRIDLRYHTTVLPEICYKNKLFNPASITIRTWFNRIALAHIASCCIKLQLFAIVSVYLRYYCSQASPESAKKWNADTIVASSQVMIIIRRNAAARDTIFTSASLVNTLRIACIVHCNIFTHLARPKLLPSFRIVKSLPFTDVQFCCFFLLACLLGTSLGALMTRPSRWVERVRDHERTIILSSDDVVKMRCRKNW